MRRLVLALLAALLVAGSTAGVAGGKHTEPRKAAAEGCVATPWPTYKHAVRRAWRFSVTSVGDYHAGPRPSSERLTRLRDLRRCHTERTHRLMYRMAKHRAARWRFHRYIDRITPYGEWAIPGSIVMCESGGVYTKWNYGGSGASGAYQAMQRTWLHFGGGRWATHAAYAPPFAQHIVAGRIWRGQGRGAWSC